MKTQAYDLKTTGFDYLLNFLKDQRPQAYSHSINVGEIVHIFSNEILNKNIIDTETSEYLVLAGVLHDIGKIFTPANLLTSPMRLSLYEFREVQKHTVSGITLVDTVQCNNTTLVNIIKNVIMYHHEWFDGGGYPYHLKGELIPIEARIIALADAFEALTSPRPYKMAYTKDKALSIMQEEGANHFDSGLLTLFSNCKEIHEYTRKEDEFKIE